MFAKGPVQAQKICRLKQCLREQVRSYKGHPAPMPKRRRFYGFGKALKPLLFDIRSGSLTER
ncbi:hypothetical protein, partial [Pseudomonas syringae]|uniref:hypothetical protein n=1 Tax=Pseudomonas syringae TaxID=317 RepID=UPI001B305775